jgi:hypothetical protein
MTQGCIIAALDKAESYMDVDVCILSVDSSGICSFNKSTALCDIFVFVSALFRYIS